ncbi:hypothetical protein M2306_003396 [Myroides gitamensis]|nr:hypothetical protein [Myroides odoratus]MDH6602702.1 hypothetical protein [Myroides gitamensis]
MLWYAIVGRKIKSVVSLVVTAKRSTLFNYEYRGVLNANETSLKESK